MKNLLHTIEQQFYPVQALIAYHEPETNGYLLESCRINKKGRFTGVHPVTDEEATTLSQLLASGKRMFGYLQPQGILPTNVLHLQQGENGYAIWHTPPQTVQLLFAQDRKIPEGTTEVPALVWKAGKRNLQVFALKEKGRPTAQTPLYYAPFHNMSTEGKVCMGTVALEPEKSRSLEGFTDQWQRYFFASYFTHTGENDQPVEGDLDELWRSLINTGKAFPLNKLRSANITLKSLL